MVLPMRLLLRSVFFGVVLLLLVCFDAPSELRADEPVTATPNIWVQEALAYADELDSLAQNTPKIGIPLPDDDQLAWFLSAAPHMEDSVTSRRRGDRVLWKMWLTTGLPPQTRQGRPIDEYLHENAKAYREYISEHASLSDEAIVRLGLINCVETIASPWWYLTIRYLEEKGAFRTTRQAGETWHIYVLGNPASDMVDSPLSPAAYGRLRGAYKRWLAKNMVENVDSTIAEVKGAPFLFKTPCVGCAELTDAILAEFDQAGGTDGKE